MNTTLSPSSSSVDATMTPDLIARVSSAYGDVDSTLTARVRALRSVLNAGITVKGMHADMLSAAASDPSITVVSTTIYGYAAAAATLASSIDGLPFSKIPAADLALFARAAKHVGVGPFKTAARAALSPLSDEVGGEERLIVLRDAFTVALSVPRADAVKAQQKSRADAEREARPNDGVVLDDAVIDGETVRGRIVPTDAADALASIRAAVKFLQHGGTADDNMVSAVAELTAAVSKARKRTPAAA